MTFHRKITTAIRQLGEDFEPNQLARLLCTGKRKRELCSALARRCNALVDDVPNTQVVRNWEQPNDRNRGAIDVAVLSNGYPAALLELETGFTFDLVKSRRRRMYPYPAEEVVGATRKLRDVSVDGWRYVLVCFTHLHEIPRDEFHAGMKYIEDMKRSGIVARTAIKRGFSEFWKGVEGLPIMAHGTVDAGRSFGVTVSLLYWLLDAR